MKSKVLLLCTLFMCMSCISLSAQETGWVSNIYEFPKNVPIQKVRLKDNGGKSEVINATYLSDNESSSSYNVTINPKKLNIKTPDKKIEFNDMEEDENGWRVYSFEKPCYFRSNTNRKNCLTNIQFFVNDVSRFPNLMSAGDVISDERVWIDVEDFKTISNYKMIRVFAVSFAGNNDVGMSFGDNESSDNNVSICSTYSGNYNFYVHIGASGFNKGRDINLNREKGGEHDNQYFYQFKKPLFTYKLSRTDDKNPAYLLVEKTEKVESVFASIAQKKENAKMPMMINVRAASSNPTTPDFTTPEKSGYMLLNTKTIAGFKCDYYAEGVRTFHFDNGDFATFTSVDKYDKKDSSRKPYNDEYAMGDWQITDENGGIIKMQSGIVRIDFPNGCYIVDRRGGALRWDVDWEKPQIWTHTFTKGNSGDLLYIPEKIEPLQYVDFKYNKNYESSVPTRDGFRALEAKGYMDGTRIYAITDEGYVFPYLQVVNGIPVPAIKTDSVVNIDIAPCTNRWGNGAIQLTIKYANGDFIVCQEESDAYIVKSGTIHRNGGVLTIKEVNGKVVKILTFENGDKYAGEFNYEKCYPMSSNLNMVRDYLCLYQLAYPELQYWTGTLIKADGKRIQYENGKTEQQIAAERKAAEAKATAEYNQLCKRFGKKYVDAALNQQPMVGMSEELLKAAFTLKFVREVGDYKLYRIMGLGWKNFGRTLSDNAHLYSIWTRNGRVVDVRYWGN